MAGIKRKIDTKEAVLVGKIKNMHESGMTPEEIASKVNCPLSAVRMYLMKIKKAMEIKANKVEE